MGRERQRESKKKKRGESLPTRVVPNKKPIKPPLKPPTGLLILAMGSIIKGSFLGKGGKGGVEIKGTDDKDSNSKESFLLVGSIISSSCCCSIIPERFFGNDSSKGGKLTGEYVIGSGSFEGGKAIFERWAGFFSPFNIVVDNTGVVVVVVE